MRPQFLAIAVLAICGVKPVFSASLGAREVSVNPSDFLKSADALIRNILTNYANLPESIEYGFENDMKIMNEIVVLKLKLMDSFRQATALEAQNLNDDALQHALKELKAAGGVLKLGEKLPQLGYALSGLNLLRGEADIESWDDEETALSLDKVREYMMDSENIEELNHYWSAILEKLSGNEAFFFETGKLIRRTAREFNTTAAEFWFPHYSEDAMSEIEAVMQQLKPFYKKLHAYVRRSLFSKYGAGVVKPHGPIPSYLHDQVMKRAWSDNSYFESDFSLYDLPTYDKNFEEHDFKAEEMLHATDTFYETLGFERLSEDTWNQRVFKTADKDFSAGAVNDKGYNVTLQYAESTTFEAYASFHELLGRIHAAALKQKLPAYFYDGYALGVPVGKAVKLAATSPKHMELLKLTDKHNFTEEAFLTRNFRMALEVMFSLPVSYVQTRVVLDFLSNKVRRHKLNNHYWTLLEEYAGVEPPVDREVEALDWPFELYVELNSQTNLVTKFRNEILGFQFYRAFCQWAGHVGQLQNCDFQGNVQVGAALKEMLSLGSSKPFDEIVAPFLTSHQKLDGNALLNYFEPIEKWLDRYIKTNDLTVGWDHTTKKLSKRLFRNEKNAIEFVNQSSDTIYRLYDQIASDLFSNKNEAADIDEHFWKVSSSAVAASELKDISLKAKQIDTRNLTTSVERGVKQLSRVADVFVLGDALEDFLDNKKRLGELATDKDILKYKDNADDEDAQYLSLSPDIEQVFLTSSDPEELKYYWEAWRETNSGYAKTLLFEILDYFKKAANILEISVTQFWFRQFSPKFLKQMESVIEELQPLYIEVHGYVKKRMIDKYGLGPFSALNGAIPDHLIQQALLQIWTKDSIVEEDFLFDELPPNDQAVKRKHFDALNLLHMAEDFYTSLGFEPLDQDFWQHRLKVQDGVESETDCHATLYDMTPKVYMKYCEKVSYKKLLQAHGYMGRLHYAVEKKNLPAYFFSSRFLEYPVGEAVILSASSPRHSQALGLLGDFEVTNTTLLNRLTRMGVHTLLKLHKHFVHTKVIADYLQGAIQPEEINKHYWQLMVKYAGIEPPSDRSAEHFDFPYEFYSDLEQNHQMKKFISEVLGYQMYESLCEKSGYSEELMNCDFYGSKEAGAALKKMMQMGSSKSLKHQLKVLLRDPNLSHQALKNYYYPLLKYLRGLTYRKNNKFDFSTRTVSTAEVLSKRD